MSGGAVLVVRPGPLSLVQDGGRPGLAHMGVGRAGAADRSSYALANRRVGNRAGAAAIECTLGGLVLRVEGDQLLVVTGAPTPVTVDGKPAQHGAVIELRHGQVVKLRAPAAGLRSYLAVRGGIDVPAVLGSRSTDTLSGLGPAPLAAGDRLCVGTETAGLPDLRGYARVEPDAGVVTLRVRLGPRQDWFSNPAALAAGTWTVSPRSNRVGLRLDRPVPVGADEPVPMLHRIDSRELSSEGVVPGAIQVPPSGQPVLFLADHPVTGGYPVIAVVRDRDLDGAAQARPGRLLRFDIDSDIRA